MINSSHSLTKTKSPILVVGLFCLLWLVACNKAGNPDDVATEFWAALSEYDLEKAKQLSVDDSAELFAENMQQATERMRNASFQIGKVKYVCDGATVETHIRRQSAQTSSSFKTVLIRDELEDRWKVDYLTTIANIDSMDKQFKSIIETTKEANERVQFRTFFRELGQAIVAVFRNLKERLLR